MSLPKAVKYTTHEGGSWIPTPQGWQANEEAMDLALLYAVRGIVQINGLQLHSVIFENGMRWDCVNGWNLRQTYVPY